MAVLLLSFSFLFIGAISGLLSGMLGIGGGTITIPFLLLIFQSMGISSEYQMQLAIGTSLASVIITLASSVKAYWKRQCVRLPIVKRMLPSILAGVVIGAYLVDKLPGVALKLFFGIFLLILAIYTLITPQSKGTEHPLPKFPLIDLLSFGISCLSTILGIGGGILFNPFLQSHKIPMTSATGTGSALALCISILATFFYFVFGYNDVPLPYTFGYIYLPAFALLSLSAYFFSPIGVKLAHTLSPGKMRKIFGVILIVVGVKMLL